MLNYAVFLVVSCLFFYQFVQLEYLAYSALTSLQVVYKTLTPSWNQTLEFPDDGSPLVLHVKDYNTILPTSSIGHCDVEYDRLPPNQTLDQWLPLQGVNKGEIHIQLTRRVPEAQLAVQHEAQKIPSGNAKLQRTAGKVCRPVSIWF